MILIRYSLIGNIYLFLALYVGTFATAGMLLPGLAGNFSDSQRALLISMSLHFGGMLIFILLYHIGRLLRENVQHAFMRAGTFCYEVFLVHHVIIDRLCRNTSFPVPVIICLSIVLTIAGAAVLHQAAVWLKSKIMAKK